MNLDLSAALNVYQMVFWEGDQIGVRLQNSTGGGGGSFHPVKDNKTTLGLSGARWSVVYAGTGSINTSDKNLKQDISSLEDAEKKVAFKLKDMVKKFRWIESVEKKGENARIHVGVIAQEVQKVFEDEGLDAHRYAIFCEDTFWEGEEEMGAKGQTQMMPVTSETEKEGYEKVTRLGIRYDQLLAFIISAL
jgi:hypothetical protein